MTDAYSVQQILGNRIAQTPAVGDSSNRVATTAFVMNHTTFSSITIGSVGASGTVIFPFNGENLVTLAGGAIGSSGLPRLLFKPSTPITPPNNTLVSFGTDATWPFTYYDYQSAIVDVIDPNGAGGLFTAVRSSDWTVGNVTNSTGATFLGVHDNTGSGPNAIWNIYAQFNKTAGASNTIETFLCEMSYANAGSSVTQDPYNVNPAGSTHNLRVDCGAGLASNTVSSAVEILNNGGNFNAGLCIGNSSIATVSSHINAIQLASSYEIVWYTAAATFGGSINVDGSSIMQFLSTAQAFNVGANTKIELAQLTGLTTYNVLTMNGNITQGGCIGLVGGATGDSNLYYYAAGSHRWRVAGSGDLMTFTAGLQLGSPTGGDKGSGTINVATNIYLNNTAYTNPDFVFEQHYTGKIEKFADKPRSKDYSGLMSIADLRNYTRTHYRLPRIDDEPTGIFTMADIALEKLEETTLYIFELEERIARLEGSLH